MRCRRCKSGNNIGEGAEAKSTVGTRNFYLRRSQIMRRKIGLNRSLISVPLTHFHHNFCYFLLFISVPPQKNLRLKDLGGWENFSLAPLPSRYSYATYKKCMNVNQFQESNEKELQSLAMRPPPQF
jgi:hypothetical protein